MREILNYQRFGFRCVLGCQVADRGEISERC